MGDFATSGIVGFTGAGMGRGLASVVGPTAPAALFLVALDTTTVGATVELWALIQLLLFLS